MAENGIEGASLRRIAAEAGQGNNSAIQYHFGDKAVLMREIILRRVAGFEQQRQEMLATAAQEGRLADVRAMIEILFRPIAVLTDSRGRHTYARFLMQFLGNLQYQAATEHPGWSRESAATRAALLIAEALPFLDSAALTTRINRIGGMFFHALIERDNMVELRKTVEPEDAFLDGLFTMMTAAMCVPQQ